MGDLYIQYEYWVAALQLIFAMLGMGATLSVKDFQDVVRIPRSVCIGLFIQLLVVPLTAFLFISLTNLAIGVILGIALIAAIPGGTTSNVFTYIAKGNVPLSISITGITTLFCLFTTPLIMTLLAAHYLPDTVSMPTKQIITDIGFTLLLPLALGMLILRNMPNHAKWISKWSIRLSLIGILIIILGSSSAGRLNLDAFGSTNLLWVMSFIAMLTTISWLSSKALKLSKQDSTAIEMEVIVRNVNLAVLIKASLFPADNGTTNTISDTMLFTILLYGGLQMLIAFFVIVLRRRQSTALSK